jgi:hypothetical protein
MRLVTRVYVNFGRLNRRSPRSAIHTFGGAKFMRRMHPAATAITALGAMFAMRDVCAGYDAGDRRGDDRSPPAKNLDIS